MITFNRILFVVSLASAFAGSGEVALAQGSSNEGFSAFRNVRSRAIFDPGRQGTRRESSAPPPQMTSRSNFIALTGTMVTPGKKLAFFHGSSSEYSKVIPEGDSVADFKLTNIGPGQVQLMLGGKALTVAVGQHVPLEGSSVPTTSEVAGAVASPVPEATAPPVVTTSENSDPGRGRDRFRERDSAPSTTTIAATPAPGAPAGSSDKSEVLRRMMERRQKEMSQ